MERHLELGSSGVWEELEKYAFCFCLFCSLWGAPVAEPVTQAAVLNLLLYIVCGVKKLASGTSRKWPTLCNRVWRLQISWRYTTWGRKRRWCLILGVVTWLSQWTELRGGCPDAIRLSIVLFIFITVHYGSVILKSATCQYNCNGSLTRCWRYWTLLLMPWPGCVGKDVAGYPCVLYCSVANRCENP